MSSLRIYKYPLGDFQTDVELPVQGTILTAQMQDGRVTLWAAVDISRGVEKRRIRVLPTGADLPDGYEYIATVQDGFYVWHVFEAHGDET